MSETGPYLRGRELAVVGLLSGALSLVLLFAAGRVGYDLFWEQLGAGVLLFVTMSAAVSSIIGKGIPAHRFLQFVLLFSFVIFSLTALTALDHEKLPIDDFETGVGGWYRASAPGVSSEIRASPEFSAHGSWHVVWEVTNSCRIAPQYWASIENWGGEFALQRYKSADFYYKTEIGEFGFSLEIRCPDEHNWYSTIMGPRVGKWAEVSVPLPPRNSSAYPWKTGGKPDPSRCHIAFSNDSNDTYHIDDIELASPTFLEQNGGWTVFGVDSGLLCGVVIVEFKKAWFTSESVKKR